jgi:acyl-CoA reductase-like NAD-dependent aldehyde dehydrogenase
VLLEYRDVYAGGRLVGSGSTDVITIVNPATEEVTGAVPSMVERDVEVAVTAARQAFDTGGWPLLAAADRAAALDRLAAALEARAEDTARLVTAEMGMPITLSRRSNVTVPCAIIRYYAALARELSTEEVREAISFAGRTVVRREPAGVAAVIASWSYPLVLAFCQLAPALAAGCTVVLLPAAETSLSAYIMAEAFEAAEFPPGVFNLVTGTAEVGEMLAAHPGVDTVAVAGPTPAGRRIAAICGQTLKPVTLELGGKSAAIVLDDVDLSAAAAGLGSLCFANSGQACFTMSRVLAPRSMYDEAVGALAAQASSLVVGDPLAEETTMGPLANPRQRASVESCVTSGITAGARVVVGGRRPATPVRGYYYEPTVFAGATAGMAIARDEICGPVVSVIPYDDESEAVAIANDSSYGLAGSVWTDDPERGLQIARRARVGTFGVNLYVPDIGAPWGGCKASGMGRIYGPEGLDSYLATKCVFLPAAACGVGAASSVGAGSVAVR